jgi:hypothetical protein
MESLHCTIKVVAVEEGPERIPAIARTVGPGEPPKHIGLHMPLLDYKHGTHDVFDDFGVAGEVICPNCG